MWQADALDSESPALSGTPLRAPRKMGLLKTKSPVISLDLGKSGEMLVRRAAFACRFVVHEFARGMVNQ